LQKFVESPLASKLLAGEFKEGDKVIARHKEGDDTLTFSTAPSDKAEGG
jgi:hypothetical protein